MVDNNIDDDDDDVVVDGKCWPARHSDNVPYGCSVCVVESNFI